ncbi:disulfide bond formation protein B, partial [Bermanella sp. 47_1433_sub80_T6]
MFKVSNQHLFLMVFLSCASLLGAAYYFEYALYLDPCPLCIMQRIAVLMVGLVGLS